MPSLAANQVDSDSEDDYSDGDEYAPKHCVRCHDQYIDAYNSGDSCVIPHVFGEEYDRVGPDMFSYHSTCCGQAVQVVEDGAGNGIYEMYKLAGDFHFVGHHTSHILEVEEDEDGGAYNGKNIKPCKIDRRTGVCKREVLEQSDREPLFDL